MILDNLMDCFYTWLKVLFQICFDCILIQTALNLYPEDPSIQHQIQQRVHTILGKIEKSPVNVATNFANTMKNQMDEFEKKVIEKESLNYRKKLRSANDANDN